MVKYNYRLNNHLSLFKSFTLNMKVKKISMKYFNMRRIYISLNFYNHLSLLKIFPSMVIE